MPGVMETVRRLRTPRYTVVGALVLALVAVSLWVSARQAQPVRAAAVVIIKLARGTVRQTYSATGQLVPQTVLTIRAVAGASVQSSTVHPGQAVSANQVLMTLSSPSLSQSIASAQQSLQSAHAKVALLASPLAAQQAALKVATAQDAVGVARQQLASAQAQGLVASRGAGIWQPQVTVGQVVAANQTVGTVAGQAVATPVAGTVAQIDQASGAAVDRGADLVTITSAVLQSATDQAKLAVVDAELAAQQAAQQYAPTALASELSQARAAATQAAGALKQLEANQAQLVVRAPFAGVVASVSAAPGAAVSAGGSLLVLDAQRMALDLSVSQAQMSLLAPGQPVSVTGRAVAAQGRIQSIGYAGSYSGGTSTFPVVVTLPPTTGLRPGMAAQASITLKKVSRGYVVPLEALHQKGRHTVLWVGNAAHHVSVPVTVLLASALDASVTSPRLKAGLPVIIATTRTASTAKLHLQGHPARPGHGHHGKP